MALGCREAINRLLKQLSFFANLKNFGNCDIIFF